MILDKLTQAVLKNVLKEGVTIDVKSKDDVPQKEEFRYGVDPKDGDKITLEPPLFATTHQFSEIEIDKYKVPFFFVTGVLIGVAFGLRHGKVVVLR